MSSDPLHELKMTFTDNSKSRLSRRDYLKLSSAGLISGVSVPWFESLANASAWADADPYVAAGVYESVEVTPFIRVMPK